MIRSDAAESASWSSMHNCGLTMPESEALDPDLPFCGPNPGLLFVFVVARLSTRNLATCAVDMRLAGSLTNDNGPTVAVF